MAVAAARVLAVLGASAATTFRCSFEPETPLDIHVYVSADPSLQSFEGAVPVWRAQGVPYSLKAPTQRHTAVLPLSEAAQHNGTLFAHVFVTPHGRSPDPQDESHARTLTSNVSHALVVHGPRPTFAPLRNLLTGERPPWQAALFDSLPPGHERQWISFFKPAVSINVVVDHESYELNAIPMVLWQHWFEQRLVSRREGRFKPIVFLNELAMVKGSWVPLNASVAEVELSLDAQPMSIRRFVWMLNLRQSFALQEETLGISEKESEELRGMFTNTHPVLLYTTVGVSALHLLFDVLAFKHDISFWRSVESMEGLSTRSVFANVAMEAVILVYLVDEGASWLVQLGSGLTLLVGVFKMFKSLRVRRADAARAAGGVSETDMYDRLAYSRLAPPVALLVVGYAAWELLFDFHRGWWAWALNSLVALVYGVGFIVMTPQLFINYKLKSVAHLPWRFFFYKFLNTFIDDLFAFIIKMPTLHRMSCFRDDIVFICFLYQRYIYPVDRKRVNEFGTTGEPASAAAADGASADGKRPQAAAKQQGKVRGSASGGGERHQPGSGGRQPTAKSKKTN